MQYSTNTTETQINQNDSTILTDFKEPTDNNQLNKPNYCKNCGNNPENGGSGICQCILGNIIVN